MCAMAQHPDSTNTANDESYFEDDIPLQQPTQLRQWEADSIAAIRKHEGYGYMPWLDSLIRSRKADEIPVAKTEKTGNLIAGFIRLLLILGIVAIIVWLLSYFVFGKRNIFRNSKQYENLINDETNTAEEPTDISSLEKAIKQGQYRRATRILFLLTLRHLQSNGYIHPAPHKTNYQYHREISDIHLQQEFGNLLLYYEYIWFGHFEPTPAQFAIIHKQYQAFLTR